MLFRSKLAAVGELSIACHSFSLSVLILLSIVVKLLPSKYCHFVFGNQQRFSFGRPLQSSAALHNNGLPSSICLDSCGEFPSSSVCHISALTMISGDRIVHPGRSISCRISLLFASAHYHLCLTPWFLSVPVLSNLFSVDGSCSGIH